MGTIAVPVWRRLGILKTGWFLFPFCIALGLALVNWFQTANPPLYGLQMVRSYTTPAIPAAVNFRLVKNFTDVIYDKPGFLEGGAGGVGLPYIEEYTQAELWSGAKTAFGVIGTDKTDSPTLTLLNLYVVDFPTIRHFTSPLGAFPNAGPSGFYMITQETDSHPTFSNGKITVLYQFFLSANMLFMYPLAVIFGAFVAWVLVRILEDTRYR